MLARSLMICSVLTCGFVACTGDGGVGGGSSQNSYQGIPFATDSGYHLMDGARVAVVTTTVLCVDPFSGARTCFHYGMDAEVPSDLRIGDEVVVVTIDGL